MQFRSLFARLLKPQTIAAKVVWAMATFLLPLGVLTYLLLSNTNDQITFNQSELQGVEYFASVRQLADAVGDHRRTAAEALTGNATAKSALPKKAAQVETVLKDIEAKEKKFLTNKYTPPVYERMAEEWKTAKAATETAKDPKSARSALEACDTFFGTTRDLMQAVADASKLTLDPEYAGYFYHFMLLNLVNDNDLLGRIQWRAALATSANNGMLNNEARVELTDLLGQAKTPDGAIATSIKTLSDERKEAAKELDAAAKARLEKRETFITNITDKVAKSDAITMTAAEIHKEAPEVTTAAYALYDLSSPKLTDELKRRVSAYRSDIYYSLASIVFGVALTSIVGFFIVRGMLRQTKAIGELFSQLNAGNFKARANVLSNDELGQMAGMLNQNVLPLVQSREDRDRIQGSIMKLLNEVSGVADGDLTKEAEVTADMTGAIADSFNYMIGQLRDVVGNVQQAAFKVSTSATQINQTADHLVNGAESQSVQIVQTTAAIDEMAASINQVSENAGMSAQVAKQSLQDAQRGHEAVKNTIDGMNRIRDQVQETAKRIKRLGESSQEIGQIVQLIHEIADRTSILALNASIQAAMAGEAGRGFAVVAEEVERLSIRSTDATKKIGVLIKSIQGETNEAVAAMEKSIQEVVDGSKVANQAGDALEQIEQISSQLAELIQSISVASKQQARGSESLVKSMNDISQITQQTAVGTKQAAQSVNELTSLADRLSNTVSTFRLPGSDGNAKA